MMTETLLTRIKNKTGEYPAGSVGAAESTGELKAGTRHRWFILFTNTMINGGFVMGAFMPCKFLRIVRFSQEDYRLIYV